jgi:hypothetical protein
MHLRKARHTFACNSPVRYACHPDSLVILSSEFFTLRRIYAFLGSAAHFRLQCAHPLHIVTVKDFSRPNLPANLLKPQVVSGDVRICMYSYVRRNVPAGTFFPQALIPTLLP